MPKRPISTDDLYKLKVLSGCRISPDGKHAVFSVNRVDRETRKKYQNLHVVSVPGGKANPFTQGDQTDHSPQWSPDGGRIAFLSNRRDEKKTELFVIPFTGGEAGPLTKIKGNILEFEWSPDGTRLVCVVQKTDREVLEREKDPKKKELGIVSRHITRVFYKLESRGYLPKERVHLWMVDARTGTARQLTDGDVFDEFSPSWSPDGQTIVYCSNRAKDPDLDPDAVDLFTIPAGGGKEKKIPAPYGPKNLPVYSPDGETIAYVGHEGRGDWWKNDRVFIVSAGGKGDARDLTGRFDVNVCAWTINDVAGHPPMSKPVWSPDGKSVCFQISSFGKTSLVSASVDDDSAGLIPLVDEEGVVGDFSFSADQSRMTYMFADMENPGEIAFLNMKTGKGKLLTRENQKILNRINLGEWESFRFKGPGGELHGWVIKPPDFNPRKKYPSVLEIHGGPHVQYGYAFMHEFYLLAAKGYVVFFCNPRGSTGYGEDHCRAIDNDWGSVDYDDVMALAEYMKKKKYIHPKKMGVTGGSYGGYMTNWIIGHTDGFGAAVTQRSVSNFISMYGSSDFNWAFEQELGNTPPWEDVDNYWRQSPIKYIGAAKTPTLVIHSEQDLRCPIEQGEQVYVALKRLGVDTEMVVFPEESHELSRGGRTDRRIERLNHILRWFDKYLG